MRMPPRRLTFQLVSLFDMLMIIIFIQFLGVENKTQKQRASAQAQAKLLEEQANARAVALKSAFDRVERELHSAEKRTEEMQTTLETDQENLAKLAELLKSLSNISDKTLADVFDPASPVDLQRLKEQLKKLASAEPVEVIKQGLAAIELEKRSDKWDLYLQDNGEFVLKVAGQTQRFRANSPSRFEEEMFRVYKALPQSKRLVIIIFSTGESRTFDAWDSAIKGLPSALERMAIDCERRTQFEYKYVGVLKQGEPVR